MRGFGDNDPFVGGWIKRISEEGLHMKKLLITGGAGFIGSEFVRQASAKGYKVAVVDAITCAGDKSRIKEAGDITFYKANICNAQAVEAILKKEKP